MMSAALLASLLMFAQDASASLPGSAEIRRVIIDTQTDCLLDGVARRVGSKTAVSEDERRTIRIAVADACYDNDVQLARVTKEVRTGTKTLDQVVEGLLTLSIRSADIFITLQLDANRRKARSTDAKD